MTEQLTTPSIVERVRWWLYAKCFAYCVRCAHPDADPMDFCLFDTTYFIGISRDEAREIIEEAPSIAWRLDGLLRQDA